jgi:arsenate reductase
MKKEVSIYHNPRCGKSREALKLLQENGCEIEVIEYLKEVPNKKELKILLDKLGIKAIDLIRKKEEIFLKKFKNKEFTNDEWIQIMIENPILIERPIVIDGYKAVVGRPPELVVDLINRKK